MNSILLPFVLLVQMSLYTLSFRDSDGNTISLSDYAGKKVLLVNTASGSSLSDQYSQLEQLYQSHKDSLVVIAFPSNSFGHEPDSNSAAIADSIRMRYNVHFIIASKTEVAGVGKDSVFQWLNGELSDEQHFTQQVYGDFQKVLLSADGNIIGVFAPEIEPLNPILVSSIESSDQ
jgi:glutathione peroxidase